MAFTVTVVAITPKGFSAHKIVSEIEGALIKEGKALQREFKKTTKRWTSHKPSFNYQINIAKRKAWVQCFPHGIATTKWRRIDEGTKKNYPIAPRRGKFRRNKQALVYQSQFTAKTRPGWLGSRSGGKTGPHDVITPRVIHPGIEPRHWSKTLATRRMIPFASNIQSAINRGLA